mmetsp:Transcript_12302/g.23057  ORF Transcript_12302/g.23057 Transcript_12302/m.23057 type:complete len:181 (+) Transcript_12302:441-983(+)
MDVQKLKDSIINKQWDRVRTFLHDGDRNQIKSVLLQKISGINSGISIDNCFHLSITRRAPLYVMEDMIPIIGNEGLISALSPENWSALHLACHYGSPYKMINLLLDVGETDPAKIRNNQGITALHSVCCDNRQTAWSVFELIVQRGGKDLVMEKDECGNTALHFACGKSFPSKWHALPKL